MENVFNQENLEAIYNILKGVNFNLTKNSLKNYIDKLNSNSHDGHLEILKEKVLDEETQDNDQDIINFDQFKSIISDFKSNNTMEILKFNYDEDPDIISLKDEFSNNLDILYYLKSGFDLADKDMKGYLNLEDLKKMNNVFNMHFTDDDLEGLLEYTSRSDFKLTFPKFVNFILKDS